MSIVTGRDRVQLHFTGPSTVTLIFAGFRSSRRCRDHEHTSLRDRVSWKSAIVSATDRMAVEKLTFLFHNRCDCRHRAVRCEDLRGEHGNAIALLCCSV